MNKPKILNIIVAYGAWIIDIGLSLWFFVLSRQAIQLWIATFYLNGSFSRRMSVRFIDQGFTIFIGLLMLIYMIVTENYYRVGVTKGMLARRIARLTGPLVLLIGLVDLFLALVLGAATVGTLRLVLVALELIVGVAIIWFGFRRKSPGQAANLTPFTGVK